MSKAHRQATPRATHRYVSGASRVLQASPRRHATVIAVRNNRLLWLAWALVLPLLWEDVAQAAEPAAPPSANAATAVPDRWCAPDLPVLASEVCYYAPPTAPAPTELVIFLHGLIDPFQKLQWHQQRAAARFGEQQGVAVIMPRGRRGLRVDHRATWWSWPTRVDARQRCEADLIDEWMAAKKALESKLGQPFAKVYVLGFSNGAYYVSSLAFRGRLQVDGYAAIAGGNAPRARHRALLEHAPRVPFYVGYGERDPTAKRDAERLRRALQILQWPALVKGRMVTGHEMKDGQLQEAIEYLRRSTHAAVAAPRPKLCGQP